MFDILQYKKVDPSLYKRYYLRTTVSDKLQHDYINTALKLNYEGFYYEYVMNYCIVAQNSQEAIYKILSEIFFRTYILCDNFSPGSLRIPIFLRAPDDKDWIYSKALGEGIDTHSKQYLNFLINWFETHIRKLYVTVSRKKHFYVYKYDLICEDPNINDDKTHWEIIEIIRELMEDLVGTGKCLLWKE